MLGTGGAAKTVICYLKDHGIRELLLVTRDPSGQDTDISLMTYSQLERFAGADLLINCTPIGMYPRVEECPVKATLLTRYGAVADLIYNPLETRLLREARQQGVKICNGLSMLVGQAIAAEELWQKQAIEPGIVEELQQAAAGFVTAR